MRIIPPPITELSFEQNFEMAKLSKSIDEADRETIIQACRELIKYNFILKCTLGNLLKHWNDPEFDNSGVDPDQELPTQP